MSNKSELHRASLTPMSQTTLIGSGQNWHAAGYPSDTLGYTDKRPPVWKQGLTHRGFVDRKKLNPPFRLWEASEAARLAHGMSGRGCWRKRRPFCNGTDRGCNITSPRKRADFQRVVRHEKTGRTDEGGNRK